MMQGHPRNYPHNSDQSNDFPHPIEHIGALLGKFIDYGLHSLPLLVMLFALGTAYHDTQPTYVGGLIVGILILIVIMQLCRGVDWIQVKYYSWRVALGVFSYIIVGSVWAYFRIGQDIMYHWDDTLSPSLQASLSNCYQHDQTLSCYMGSETRERIYLYITFWPMNVLTYLARDPIRQMLTFIVDHTSEFFYNRIHSAVSFKLEH